MARFLPLSALVFLIAIPCNGQTVTSTPNDDSFIFVKKSTLLFDLQALNAEAAKLDKPLARGRAKAEIADGAWTLDQAWAKKLLLEAYELTFPEEQEGVKLPNKPVGAAPTQRTHSDWARNNVRERVFEIAGRDKAFAVQLGRLTRQELGIGEEHDRYSNLASQAIKLGDTDAAVNYISRAIQAEPTQIPVGFAILDLAARDRAAADSLIIQFIRQLREIPISMTDLSAPRVYFILRQMVFPDVALQRERGQIPPTGHAAVTVYVSYVIESMTRLSQREPESLSRLRHVLMSVWLPLNEHARELVGPFLILEGLSRRPSESARLPQPGDAESRKARNEEQVRDALKSGSPDDLTIMLAIGREEFSDARKMIDLLPDGERKTRFIETVNTREAISLARKGDSEQAERFAQRLNEPWSILQAYSLIIGKCVANKDQSCAITLTYQAMKQLRNAKDPTGIPLSLTTLAKTVVTVNETLALEVLDEAVLAANRSNLDTGKGYTGLDLNAFKILLPKDGVRVRQAASTLRDPLARITALAAICQGEIKELAELDATRQRVKSQKQSR